MEKLTVRTRHGSIRGICRDGYRVYLGIPYATAQPFQPPRPVSWNGMFEALRPGLRAWQADDPSTCGDDCLNLNIFIPEGTEEALPVVLDIHGGAFQGGSNRDHLEIGRGLLRGERFIYVAINYRVGVWGYLYLGDHLGADYKTSGNNGLLDQIAALRWVRENIGSFGGNPEQITLLGLSAGGKSVSALMAAPESRRLFHRAIQASGGTQSIRTIPTARGVADRYLDLLGNPAPQELLCMKPETLLEAQKKFCAEGSTCFFGPVADGVVLPSDWEDRLYSQEGWNGAVLIGSCRNECGGFAPLLPEQFEPLSRLLFGANADYAEAVKDSLPAGLTREERISALCGLLSDMMYRSHGERMAERLLNNGCPVWRYSQEAGTAYHGTDFLFLWEDYLQDPALLGTVSLQDAELVSEALRRAFTGMILAGEPKSDFREWPNCTDKQSWILRLDTPPRIEALTAPDARVDVPWVTAPV